MPTHELSETTALVTGASRGFGRAIAVVLAKHDAYVAGVARDHARLEELRAQLGESFAADAADPVVAGQLLDEHRPRTLVLNAGAAPLPRPIHRQTWQTFSRNWDVDVQHSPPGRRYPRLPRPPRPGAHPRAGGRRDHRHRHRLRR
jgi:NADP-dependent 3-hydroxy acid dehydrogenase YdfG